ncbi:major facilitator superfamily domain-containing protein [Dipodascopsis tothii]|uniref:major facilitator superfamily domain-containing protein n=1 Tax=Dipodascopsis tothii TaxID=44089 RepID=UPI0034CF2028
MASDTLSVQESGPETKVVAASPYQFAKRNRPLTRRQRVLGVIWDVFKKEPEERRYVLRLDFFLFAYSLLSYIVKILDQSNISNAYVSGMKEDLKLYGQERNLFNTFFNMGYLVGSVPCQIVMNRSVRPSLWIPSCELVWAALVMCIAACKSARPIYGLRFVIGLAESAAFPGFNLILGSWYTPEELGKRMALFEMSAQAANMFSGYIQTGVYSSMNGRYGIAGWRWLFIIDGIISIPVATAGYFAIPDFPTTTRARWLSTRDRDYSVRRMEAVGRKPPKKLTVREFVRIFSSPRPYLFLLPYNISGFGSYTSYFNLWLKAVGYSVQKVNLIPTAGNGIGLVAAYVGANLSDLTGVRWPWMIVSVVPILVGAIMLSVWDIPASAIIAANFIANIGTPLQPLAIAWSAEVFQDSAATRGLVLGFGNTISYTMSAWLPLLMFPSQDAPHYKYGYQLSAAFQAAAIVGILIFLLFTKWEQKKLGLVKNDYGLMVRPDELDDRLGVVEVNRDEKTATVVKEIEV